MEYADCLAVLDDDSFLQFEGDEDAVMIVRLSGEEVGKHQLILGLLPQPQEFHLSILDEVGILAHAEYGFHFLDEFGTNEGHDE